MSSFKGRQEELRKALQNINQGRVTCLNLSRCGLGPEDIRVLAEALQRNTSVQKLNLSGNRFGDKGCAHLADGLRLNRGVVDLDLSSNDITGSGFRPLSKKLKINEYQKTRIQRLNLEGNSFSPKGATSLYLTLKLGSTVKDLRLSELNEVGVEKMAESLLCGATKLGALRLVHCEVSKSFVLSLWKLLDGHPSIVELGIGSTFTDTESVELFFNSLKENKSVQVVSFIQCNITDRFCELLSCALVDNASIKAIRFENCSTSVSQPVLDGLCKNLKQNNSLEVLEGFEQQLNAQQYLDRNRKANNGRSYGFCLDNTPQQSSNQGTRKLPQQKQHSGRASPTSGENMEARGTYKSYVKRFVGISGKLKAGAFIAAHAHAPVLAIVSRAPQKKQLVTLLNVKTQRFVAKISLGHAVGPVSFDPKTSDLEVACIAEAGSLIGFKPTEASLRNWHAVWTKKVIPSPPKICGISSIQLSGEESPWVCLKYEDANPKYVVIDTNSEYTDGRECYLLPVECQYISDISFLPDGRSFQLVKGSSIASISLTQFQTQLTSENQKIITQEVLATISYSIDPELDEILLIKAIDRILVLRASRNSKEDPVFAKLTLSRLEMKSATHELEECEVSRLRGLPKIVSIEHACVGFQNRLFLQLVEQVKEPGKKYKIHKRYVFTVDTWDS